MGLTPPALDVLLTRLLWPVPRVRLEAARAIAGLIRSGNRNAGDGLLNWISERTYESETVLGLNIIEAFDLAPHFEFARVRDAVTAPSHLSDWILKANFHQEAGLFPFRYAYAPPGDAPLSDRIRATFSAFNGVPQMFQSHLEHLEEMSSLPFLNRWRHEWEWLQVDDHRGMGDPSYFFHGDREKTGQFDFQDRETYVSAYLRTLAFAAAEWGLPHDMAEQHSRAGLTLNRGLAGVEPISRPTWSDGIIPGDRDLKRLAADIWDAAASDVPDDDSLSALRAVEVVGSGYAVFEFDRVTAATATFVEGASPSGRPWSYLANPARYEGGLYPGEDADEGKAAARKICSTTMVFDVGRGSVELVTHVHMPSPRISALPFSVDCASDHMDIRTDDEVIASWRHWYADWDPTSPREVRGLVGFATTVKSSVIERYCERHAVQQGVWCKVTWGAREYSYGEWKSQSAGIWIAPTV
ncbi:hypothetical protein [Brevundimonas sp.]|uniref:hypothetical protein n=1 Tax=Brevundimonas sp. TaxID=1871086 RepID=UPI003F7308C0